MNKPTMMDLFVCARTWDEAKALTGAIAEGKIELGARHQNHDDATAWCKRVNDASVFIGVHSTVWRIRVSWHYGPDCKIFNYTQIAD